jgi:nicotinamidase-related amidase
MARQTPPLLPVAMSRLDWRVTEGSPPPGQSPARENLMTSEPIRDPRADHLLTPQNCALVIIDYQPVQVRSVNSMDQDLLVDRVVHLARFALLYQVPVVLSTVNVSNGRNLPTIEPLADVLRGITAVDRTTINAWEDLEFRQAVLATRRRKLIMAALWTEACLTFPALDAMCEGFEIYPVTDAVGGTSSEAHQAGLERIALAGGRPTSVVQVGCELQRDWSRVETSDGFSQILFGGQQPLAGASTEHVGHEVSAAH